MTHMEDEDVAIHLISSAHGNKLKPLTGDLQEFVDTILDVTEGQTAVLYWKDMYNKGSYAKVATTSGYTSSKDSFTLEELAGVTGESVAITLTLLLNLRDSLTIERRQQTIMAKL